MPSWLCNPGPVFLKRHVRLNKTDPLVDEVELIQANPHYAHIRYPDGKETTVSIKHLAPANKILNSETQAQSCDTADEVVTVPVLQRNPVDASPVNRDEHHLLEIAILFGALNTNPSKSHSSILPPASI